MPSPPNALSVISAATTPSAVLTDQLASSLVSVLTTRRGVGLTDMTWEHAAEVRAALKAIITDPEQGVAALSSAQTMSNLLKDLLPDAPREKSILVAAAEAGLANTLRQHVDQGMDPNTAIRLTASSFSSTTPFTPEACTWVTNEIATALGLRHSGGWPGGGGYGHGPGQPGGYGIQQPGEYGPAGPMGPIIPGVPGGPGGPGGPVKPRGGRRGWLVGGGIAAVVVVAVVVATSLSSGGTTHHRDSPTPHPSPSTSQASPTPSRSPIHPSGTDALVTIMNPVGAGAKPVGTECGDAKN